MNWGLKVDSCSMNKYKTQSLALAAALQVASTSKLEFIDFPSNSSKATFHFDKSLDPSFDEIVALFFAHQLPIDAATYFESIRFIKSRLYEGRS